MQGFFGLFRFNDLHIPVRRFVMSFLLLTMFQALNLFAQTVIPIQGKIRFHDIKYYLHYETHSVFFGDWENPRVVIRKNDDTEIYLNQYGRLLHISEDGLQLTFEKATVTLANDSLTVEPEQHRVTGKPINRFAFCYHEKKNRYVRLGKELRLNAGLAEFLKKNKDKKIVDVSADWVVYLEQTGLTVFNGNNTRTFELPKNSEFGGLWFGKDSLKVLITRKSFLSDVVERAVLTYSLKPPSQLVRTEKVDFLSPTDGKTTADRREIPSQGGMLPVSEQCIYLSLSDGIYRLKHTDKYWELQRLLKVGGYLSYILPGPEYWLASEVDDDSVKTYRVEGVNKHPVWRRYDQPLRFVEIYDSLLVYQLGRMLGFGPPGKNSYRLELPAESRVTDFQQGGVVLQYPSRISLEKVRLVNGKPLLSPLFSFADRSIQWIILLKRLPLPIKRDWEFYCSTPDYTFKEKVAVRERFENPVRQIRFIGNVLFVSRKNHDLCLVPLLREGKTRLPYKVFSLKYAFGKIFLFSGRGLEIYQPEAFEKDKR